MANKNLNKVFSQLLIVESVTADKTLDLYDTGKIFVVNPAAETTITLPTLTTSTDNLATTVAPPGWHCKIVLTEGIAVTNGSMDAVVNIALTTVQSVGHIVEVDGAAGNFCVADDNHVVFHNSATPGDYVDIFSDGTQWYIYGVVKDLTDADFSDQATTIQ